MTLNGLVEELLRGAADRALRYLRELPDRPVAVPPDALPRLAELDVPLPDKPVPVEDLLALLDDVVAPATTATTGPRFFGFPVAGPVPAAIAAGWLTAAWGCDATPTTAEAPSAPGPVAATETALRWLVELLGLPAGTAGRFTAGHTAANVVALAAARHAVLARAGWNVAANGLFGAPPVTVVTGDEVHPAVLKALALLGFGQNRVTRVRVDGQGRLRPTLIPPLTGPTIVCAQAGNANSGAVDPLTAICARAHDDGAWVHVDGGFGLCAAASPLTRDLVAGAAHADSWTTDPGTWLGPPFDTGLALVRDAEALEAAVWPSGSASGVQVWAALAALGRDGVAELVERVCAAARRFARELAGAGYPVLNEVVLNQILVGFGSAARTAEVVARVRAEGVCFCGGTVWQGRPAMRISLGNGATTDEDIARGVTAIRAAAA